MTSASATSPESKLRALFQHHLNHTETTAFIDIHLNDIHVFQFAVDIDEPSRERFTVTQDGLDLRNEDIELNQHETGVPPNQPKDWTVDSVINYLETELKAFNATIGDVTYAVEQECPNKGIQHVEWDDRTDEADMPTDTSEEIDPRERLLSAYEYLQKLSDEAEGAVPEPFPLVELYVDGDKLPYVVGPNVHSLDYHTDDERATFDAYCDDHPNIESTAAEDDSISVTHYTWAPETALDVTEDLLDELYNYSLDDITHAKITSAGPDSDLSWTEV
ncbi:hypothetical protein [Natrinema sp. SYSU A 869]|uniref:hypothetical protein n=1 Tax=Natrinema sp. SYSU A 869 TaxID=2871694 RepID=UPI001CA46256|nr:hypothetical protein [Natrinema sp. SYSU A 869]